MQNVSLVVVFHGLMGGLAISSVEIQGFSSREVADAEGKRMKDSLADDLGKGQVGMTYHAIEKQ